jgi:hypothetical protein
MPQDRINSLKAGYSIAQFKKTQYWMDFNFILKEHAILEVFQSKRPTWLEATCSDS